MNREEKAKYISKKKEQIYNEMKAREKFYYKRKYDDKQALADATTRVLANEKNRKNGKYKYNNSQLNKIEEKLLDYLDESDKYGNRNLEDKDVYPIYVESEKIGKKIIRRDKIRNFLLAIGLVSAGLPIGVGFVKDNVKPSLDRNRAVEKIEEITNKNVGINPREMDKKQFNKLSDDEKLIYATQIVDEGKDAKSYKEAQDYLADNLNGINQDALYSVKSSIANAINNGSKETKKTIADKINASDPENDVYASSISIDPNYLVIDADSKNGETTYIKYCYSEDKEDKLFNEWNINDSVFNEWNIDDSVTLFNNMNINALLYDYIYTISGSQIFGTEDYYKSFTRKELAEMGKNTAEVYLANKLATTYETDGKNMKTYIDDKAIDRFEQEQKQEHKAKAAKAKEVNDDFRESLKVDNSKINSANKDKEEKNNQIKQEKENNQIKQEDIDNSQER